MRQREQKLWDAMDAGLSQEVFRERVENMVNDGTPDVTCLCRGVQTMVELKAVMMLPRRAGSKVLGDNGLNTNQRNYCLDWTKRGGRYLIVIGIGVGRLRQHLALWGTHGDTINDYDWATLFANAACAGVGAAFWPRLEQLLGSRAQ